jgi:hypothetical protein
MTRKFLSGVGVCATLGLIACSATMNYLFMCSQGRTAFEGQVLGSVSVAADVMKALVPMYVSWAIAARRWFYVPVGTVLFAACAAVSFSSAFGFIASNRLEVAAEKVQVQRRVARLGSLYEELGARLSNQSNRRATGEIDDVLQAMRFDRRWTSSRNCEYASVASNRVFCEKYFRVRAERAQAEQAERLERERDALGKKLESVIAVKSSGDGGCRLSTPADFDACRHRGGAWKCNGSLYCDIARFWRTAGCRTAPRRGPARSWQVSGVAEYELLRG